MTSLKEKRRNARGELETPVYINNTLYTNTNKIASDYLLGDKAKREISLVLNRQEDLQAYLESKLITIDGKDYLSALHLAEKYTLDERTIASVMGKATGLGYTGVEAKELKGLYVKTKLERLVKKYAYLEWEGQAYTSAQDFRRALDEKYSKIDVLSVLHRSDSKEEFLYRIKLKMKSIDEKQKQEDAKQE